MSLGDSNHDNLCVAENSQSLGWIAALYFFLFILFGVMVLLSLFVGVIISAMELLKDYIKEENAVWNKVNKLQKRFNYSDSDISTLLEIFDLIDSSANGKLKVVSSAYTLFLNN